MARHSRRLLRLRSEEQLPKAGNRRALLVNQLCHIRIRLQRRDKRRYILFCQLARLEPQYQRLQLCVIQLDDVGSGARAHGEMA